MKTTLMRKHLRHVCMGGCLVVVLSREELSEWDRRHIRGAAHYEPRLQLLCFETVHINRLLHNYTNKQRNLTKH